MSEIHTEHHDGEVQLIMKRLNAELDEYEAGPEFSQKVDEWFNTFKKEFPLVSELVEGQQKVLREGIEAKLMLHFLHEKYKNIDTQGDTPLAYALGSLYAILGLTRKTIVRKGEPGSDVMELYIAISKKYPDLFNSI